MLINIVIIFFAVYTSGTLPLEIHQAEVGVGTHSVHIIVTDVLNLTDADIIEYLGKTLPLLL